MSHRIRTHFRHNVIGYVALFFSLSLGTAWALGTDSVKSKHIKDGQVRAADVADDTTPHALTGLDIKNDSMGGHDIIDGDLRGADIADGSLAGIDIANNAVTAIDLGQVTTRFGTQVVEPGTLGTATASCLAGEELLGGGGGFDGTKGYLTDSQRDGTSNTWTVTAWAYTDNPSSEVLVAEAMCLTG